MGADHADHDEALRPEHPAHRARHLTCAAMLVAAVGVVTGAALGTPLVSFLLAGLLLLCPLLMWVPFHFERRSVEGSIRRERRRA